MKIKYLIISLICVFLICSVPVLAAEDFVNVIVDYDRAAGTIVISGEVPSVGNDADSAQLLVVKPDTDLEALEENELLFITAGVHADETALSNKSFTFDSFSLPSGSAAGDYIVRITADTYTYETTISYATVSQTIELLNAATTATEVLSCINKYNDVYGFDIGENSRWQALSPEYGQSYVCTKLADALIETTTDAQNIFNEQILLYQIYTGPWGAIEQIINENNVFLTFDMTAFNRLSDDEKDNVYKEMVGNLYATKELASDGFDIAVEKAKTIQTGNPVGSTGTRDNKKSEGVAIQAEIENVETVSLPFADLEGFNWAENAVSLLYSQGIVNGRSNTEFAPGEYVKRAEAVKMIVLALDIADENAACSFTDVSPDIWSYQYVASADKSGIISGYPDGTFGAEAYITREDLCVMVVRAANTKGKFTKDVTEAIFNDSKDISDYAKDAVNKLCDADIINGAGNNMFLPKAFANRAETAKIIAALLS